MRVSLNWLKTMLPDGAMDNIETAELTHILDTTGTVVEGVEQVGAHLNGIYVGKIVSKSPHPDSDHLWVTTVDVGENAGEFAGDDGLLQIVCGAQNFECGDKVPVATVGTVFDDDGKDFVIKKSKLRGVESFGMNCSARELGIGGDHSGLMILPADAPVGQAFADYYGIGDTILDLEITPNRPDCLSMVGCAREFGAVLSGKPTQVTSPEGRAVSLDDASQDDFSGHDTPVAHCSEAELKQRLNPVAELNESGEPIETLVSVHVEDENLCPRYAARVIRGVKVGPSPDWLAQRVTAAGARSINNIVDVTNYILFELGQPLHAFDLNAIATGTSGKAEVTVRRAKTGESIKTLDDVTRPLSDSNLLIADPSGPITLAGVMGAQSTEVEDDTTDIFLEAAVFDPATTSRTSRKMALISESSLRFERGVDIDAVPAVLDRAAALIAAVADGTVAPGVIDLYPNPAQPQRIILRSSRMHEIIGERIELETAHDLLVRLGFAVEKYSPDKHKEDKTIVNLACTSWEVMGMLVVTVPTFRPDVEREIDLVEEVLRLWGMENVTATLPTGEGRIGGYTHSQTLRRNMNSTLRSTGLNETMTYPFGDPADLEKLDWVCEGDECLVALHNPMSTEQATLRRMLLPGLLNSVSLNKRRGVTNVHLYEMGAVFATAAGRKQPKEREMVAAVLSGSWNEAGWNDPATPLDFFDAKGIVETVARELNIDRMRLVDPKADTHAWLQPGKGAVIMMGNVIAGWIGEIHPLVARQFSIDDVVVAFEFEVEKFTKAAKPLRDIAAPPRFPAIEMDIALVVDEDVTHQAIQQRIAALGKKSPLESARLFDVYRGKGVERGKKSMAYRLAYRNAERTLTTEEVEKVHVKLLERLRNDLGAELRG